MPSADFRAVVAVLALLAAPLTTLVVARGRITFDREAAREARTQERLEMLYIDVMDWAYLVSG